MISKTYGFEVGSLELRWFVESLIRNRFQFLCVPYAHDNVDLSGGDFVDVEVTCKDSDEADAVDRARDEVHEAVLDEK